MNNTGLVTSRFRQRGMALLLCLVFMTSMTLLGLTAATDTITQTQLAANLQDAERARQSGLLSLDWVEDWLFGLGVPPVVCSNSCSGFYTHPMNSLSYDVQSESLAWWAVNGFEVGLDPVSGARLSSIGTTGSDPSFWVVQHLHQAPASTDGSTPELNWYRILTRTSGRSPSSVKVLESTVIVGWAGAGTIATPARRVAWQELR